MIGCVEQQRRGRRTRDGHGIGIELRVRVVVRQRLERERVAAVNVPVAGRVLGAKRRHLQVDALWSFSPHADPVALEQAAAGNLKRAWVNHNGNPDWTSENLRPFLEAGTETKTIWVPYGE